MEDLAPVYPGGDTVQDLQVHQGHAEHVLGRGLLGRSRGGGEYSTINDIILYVVWKGNKRFHKKGILHPFFSNLTNIYQIAIARVGCMLLDRILKQFEDDDTKLIIFSGRLKSK